MFVGEFKIKNIKLNAFFLNIYFKCFKVHPSSRHHRRRVEKKLGYYQKHFAFFRVANLIKWKFSFPKWSFENKVIKTFFDFDETQS
jgi:hypothetical protein